MSHKRKQPDTDADTGGGGRRWSAPVRPPKGPKCESRAKCEDCEQKRPYWNV
eukprot:COSAG03_NODE_3401_length_2039_cov_6.614593_1_plen_51_part_10